MATWKYLKGDAKDFEGAPDWATRRTKVGRKEYFLPERTEVGKPVYNIEKMKEEEILFLPVLEALIAQRERVTSVSDDRLVQALIAERGNRYGKFADGAEIMRDLKHVMHEVDGWNNLTASQKEALDMIQHKIGRILNGDPTYDDNWKDIAGYATLVAEELNGVKK